MYIPLEDNSVHATGRARSFSSFNPSSSHKEICGRKVVGGRRTGRIVGGGVANYAEWPWTVDWRVMMAFLLSPGLAEAD
jgi:hypothetical protein